MIDRRNQRHELKQNNQRRSKRAHQRKSVGRANHHVEKRNRPGHEDNYLEQVRNRAATELVTANRQESSLKNEPQADGDEIKPPRPKNSVAQFKNGVRTRHQKTDS